jgi:hypothetical protein
MKFSVGKGLAHAFVGFVVILLTALVVGLVADVKDPEKFGQGVGRFAFFGAISVFGVSYLFQTKRQKGAWLAIIGFAVLVGGGIGAVVLMPHAKHELTAADKAPMLPTDDGRLAQHALGFSIAALGSTFEDVPASMYSMLKLDEHMHAWGFTDRDDAKVVFVFFAAGPSGSKASLEEILRGVKSGMVSNLATNLGAGELQTVDETVDYPTIHAHYTVGKINIRIDALADKYGDVGQGVAMVLTFDGQGDRLSDVGASLRKD